MSEFEASYFLGLPMWQHGSWPQTWFDADIDADTIPRSALSHYAQCFNAVEGNTSFYATPKLEQVLNWLQQVPDDFCFVFKFPRAVSHLNNLHIDTPECKAFLDVFLQAQAALHAKNIILWLQLPAQFSPLQLPQLLVFLDALPQQFEYLLEVRHIEFFTIKQHRIALCEALDQRNIDLVCFDSRALFSCTDTSAVVLDAQQKKPRLPVKPVALGRHPCIRYIAHPELSRNAEYLQAWYEYLCRWLQAGLQPLVFIHTPDNVFAPQLAHQFHQQLEQLAKSKGVSLKAVANISEAAINAPALARAQGALF